MTLACAEIDVLMHGHLDGELDAANALQVEEHLRRCPACADAYRRLKTLRAQLHRGEMRHRAPDALRARILATLEPVRAAPAARPAAGRWWRRLLSTPSLGVPAFTAAAAVLAAFLILPRPSADLRQELVSEHVRSLMADHITDVATSDQHTVKPWFDGRLDFAPPVVDLADVGFALAGGRLDYIAGRSVAALVYRRREHVINLFIWPAEKTGIRPDLPQSSVDNGYNALHWSGSGMTFWAISDLNAAELQEFMHRFTDRLAHP